MATQVQWRQGTTVEHTSFTGVVAEVTVDTTKDTLVVHDGFTAGGHPLAKESDIADMLVTSDIGSTVQAYDADTTKNDVANTFTANQTINGTLSVTGNATLGDASTDLHTVNGGLQITRAALTSPVSTDGNVYSGSYTPVGTAITNVTTVTPQTFYFTRVGNQMHVWGFVDVLATAAAAADTAFTLSLPVASNFTVSGDGVGVIVATSSTTSRNAYGSVRGDATNDNFSCQYASNTTASVTFRFTADYIIK